MHAARADAEGAGDLLTHALLPAAGVAWLDVAAVVRESAARAGDAVAGEMAALGAAVGELVEADGRGRDGVE